jgi:sugar (glycoside-pentoside-hexuronide) transporter
MADSAVVKPNEVENDPQRPYISIWRRIGYAGGDVGGNMGNSMILGYLMIFLTDVAKISAGFVGNIMLIARLWDAINDPIVGSLADHTKSRWGRYRPWVLFSGVPFFLICIATFTTNPEWSYTTRCAWALGTYFMQVLGYTCINIPFSAMTSVITLDGKMRAKISSVRVGGTFLAQIILNFATLRIVNWAQATTGSEARGFQLAIIIYSIIGLPFLIMCFLSNKEVVKTEKQDVKYKEMFKALKGNTPLWQLTGIFVVWGCMAAGSMLKSYYWRYNIGYFMGYANNATIGAVGSLIGTLTLTLWVNRFEKHRIIQWAFFGGAMMNCIQYFIPAGTASWGIPAYYCSQFFTNYCTGLCLGSMFGLVPDITEFARYHSGIYASGFLSSFINFAYKFGGALMGALAGWVMAAIGYRANEVQTPFVLNVIRAQCHFWVAGCLFAASFIASRYKLDKKMYEEIVAHLEKGEYAPGVVVKGQQG